MGMLDWNQRKVRQLTGGEIASFIAGRVLVAFGVGLLLPRYVPGAVELGWPAIAIGVLALAIAMKGYARQASPGAGPPDAPRD